ncbi:glycerophosphodiester phosphodiesterase [Chungangia koreensis]|uniref:Glycerophosphodiester phosphodiesterase n=1 Tax=Chungangia koreensis TaxID=752657 RepID=A0ABV8X4A5_9LACT
MKIYAHRGSSGTAPENTIAAFREAASLPIHGVEFDVHMTKDGELVVIHDERIDRTTTGSGFVKDMTLGELRQFDAGSWFSADFVGQLIPTLEEVLEVFKPRHHHINIELKSDVFPYEGMGDKVVALVERMGLTDRVVISSFDHVSIRSIKRTVPQIETGALFVEVLVDAFEYGQRIPANALHMALPASLRPASAEAMAKGAVVRVFTVNEEQYVDLLLKTKVEAIFTDYPERMYNYINRKS